MSDTTQTPEPFLAEDFTQIGELIEIAATQRTDDLSAILVTNIPLILAALRLAPIGLAAVAALNQAMALERAVAEWRAANV